ncbi:hypothetical protein HPB47_014518 [Ixodes persulcatus]|uniref:Uncharacterized protein n=1 Tax=Ixodes persulcatus TaxID=34615 RepID=A0AC60QX64_IXOPE|nr:hypothetical protein HPB47_014518 [Ixodes persulcatus]
MAVSAFPPSYSEATRQHASLGGGLSFVDFLPYCISSGGLFSTPTFEPFRTLVNRANEWLKENPTWEVKTCESVEFKTSSEVVNTERMTYYEYGEQSTRYVRSLRLWLVPRLDQSRPPQQIEYRNLIPQQTGHAGLFGMPTFETLHELLERYNQQLRYQPMPGELPWPPHYSNFDPDRSYWSEYGGRNRHFLFVVRVFYELGSAGCEEIGVADFVPQCTTTGGLFSFPRYEPFCNVIGRSAQWCSQQRSLRFCNAQSLEVKLKSGTTVDTQRMSYTEHAERTTFYVRVLRVAYSKEPAEAGLLPPSPPLALHCKTFLPLQLTRGLFVPEFESLSATKKRLEAWIRATGARVLSCETVAMRLFTGGEAHTGIESSFTYNNGNRSEYWIFVLRLYLDGAYQEPPQEVLPPPPEVRDVGCCTVL